MAATNGSVEIPKTCKAGVVVNEGPDFRLEVEDVPVPEPGESRVVLAEISIVEIWCSRS